ncbi:MAG: PspA/IM30 family protein, partial [Acidimicrobiales bacterium]
MIKLFRKMGKYMTAMFTGKFNEVADPKIQLEQAIIEAQDQHRRLTEQAANVIASQKQTEMNLNRSMAELETTSSRA